MRKWCLIFFLSLSFVISYSQTKPEKGKDLPGKWAQLNYDKVVVYKTKVTGPFVRGKHLVDSLVLKKVVLSKVQADTLKSFLFNTLTYGALPVFYKGGYKTGEYTFVFFSNNSVVSHLTIFLESNTLNSNYEIPARAFKKIKDPKESYYLNGEGFSPNGKKKVISFLKSLGFDPIVG